MKEVKIIGLSGDRNSGKDTIADLLVKNWGYQKLELAKLSKEILCRRLGIKLESLTDRETKEFYREQIIDIAEKLKELDTYFHCKVVHNEILELIKVDKANLCISDIRYPYEAHFFRRYYTAGFQSIYIESDLAQPHPEIKSESYIHTYFKKNNDGIIINNRSERYDNQRLVNQLFKFV